MTIEQNESLTKKPLFNPQGDLDVRDRRMIGGNTTNLNDFNNMKYPWVSDWYRQAMNNFWIPEEINLGQDVKDYPHLDAAERAAYDKILSFLVFLDPVGEPAGYRRIHHGERGESLPEYSDVPGMRAFAEL